MYIEQSAYNSLEISNTRSSVSRRCRSELGALVAENIAPAADLSELTKRRELFEDVEKYRGRKGELPWTDGLVSVAFMLEFAEENGLLSGEELVKIRLMLMLSGRMRETLTEARDEYPAFSILLRSMRDFAEETEMLSVIDDEGHLYDYASEKLAAVRREMRGLKDTLRRKGHALLGDPRIASMLQERVLTLRNGRHAFLVRQDAISQFPGAVIERSGSGNSVYMEPHSLMSLNNEYSKLYGEEMLEETRIFREFTARLIKRKKGILDTENVLGTVDLFYALSETARLDKWRMPDLSKRTEFSFVRARTRDLVSKSVPIDIKCGDKFRIPRHNWAEHRRQDGRAQNRGRLHILRLARLPRARGRGLRARRHRRALRGHRRRAEHRAEPFDLQRAHHARHADTRQGHPALLRHARRARRWHRPRGRRGARHRAARLAARARLAGARDDAPQPDKALRARRRRRGDRERGIRQLDALADLQNTDRHTGAQQRAAHRWQARHEEADNPPRRRGDKRPRGLDGGPHRRAARKARGARTRSARGRALAPEARRARKGTTRRR